ncbi:MAG TPA: ribonuclease R [Thermodesulfobacteriota bacterium]|nr:ribonuclease R [Thermodesulfobacteriota bacterium]
MEESQKKILELMKEASYRPMSFKELIHLFSVSKDKRDRFKRVVKTMVSEGTLVKIRGGRYGLPSKMNLVTGELICHPDGFGFVRPEEGGEDVFINPRKLGGAMHGDAVVARVEGYKDRGRREGKVIRVVKRAHTLVTGRFERGKGFGVVVPSDERILERIVIPPRETRGAAEGTIVTAEITRWPGRDTVPAGKVVEILGDPDDPDVEAEVILKKFGLPARFPSAVEREVRDVPMTVGKADLEGRVDLRGFTTVTIDGETAKDFDDAVSVDRTPNGYRLRVSIADVSRYVREGSDLDAEAYARGTSVYFPDRCIPMLPEALSNGICSLNPGVDRLTVTAELEFDSRGAVRKKRFYESVIKSAERMTYTNVKKLLGDEDASLSERYSAILGDLKVMAELAAILTDARKEAGSIDFDLPEPQIIIDIEGNVEDIVRSERNVAHRLIEEFMLAANRAVAEEFSSRDLPFLYRIHEEPDEESVRDFAEFISGFGLHFKSGTGPKAFQKILKAVEGRPEERLVNHVLLRSMKQAVYSEENAGHFGLAFRDYTHFTSPIRRYPDLIVHRLLKLHMHGKYGRDARDRAETILPELAGHTSARERKAMEAEREIADLKKCQFMTDRAGDSFDGFISGVTSFGLFVELKEYFVEGLVHISTLLDDYYVFEEKRHSLTGEHTKRTFRLGDPLRVTITKVDMERRRIDLVLAEGFAVKDKGKGKEKRRGRKR